MDRRDSLYRMTISIAFPIAFDHSNYVSDVFRRFPRNFYSIRKSEEQNINHSLKNIIFMDFINFNLKSVRSYFRRGLYRKSLYDFDVEL